MLKRSLSLLLFLLAIENASGEDSSLIVSKHFKENFDVGGVFSLFHKKNDIKKAWIELKPKSGTVMVQSITLDGGKCTFDSVLFPVSVAFNQDFAIRPHCNVAEAEIMTDRGTYDFRFDKSVD